MRLACFVCSCLLAAAAAAVEPLPGVLAVAGYSGADRTARLIAGARKEGELMIYSSLTPPDQLRLAEDFKNRYGVTLKFWRGSQTNILQRVLTETRGGRFEFDALETNSPQIEAIAREKLLQKMNSPFVDQVLLPQTLPQHGEWTPDRLNLLVYAYNTNAVRPPDVPKAWADLLRPKWKGRIGMESTNSEWFAAIVQSKCLSVVSSAGRITPVAAACTTASNSPSAAISPATRAEATFPRTSTGSAPSSRSSSAASSAAVSFRR